MKLKEQQLRIVIVAENASYRFGGEASLPLQYFSRLRARGFDLWLVVHSRTKPELNALFPNQEDRILTIPDMWVHKLLWRVGTLLPRRLSEAICGTLIGLFNQFLQRRTVRKLVREKDIHLVHQPIPVSPKAPSFLYGLGVPVVIGPMNGGMQYPPAFRNHESPITRALVTAGRASASFVNRIIRGKREASLLLVANQRTKEALPACVQGEVIILPENGVDLHVWTPGPKSCGPPREGEHNYLFLGRLVDWKRLDIVIHALTRVPRASLKVIGDGPERTAWARLVMRLNLGDRVEFVGWLSQPESARYMQEATALVLPSVYECGGAVVLEAMATGIPVIATAWGGPADYLDESCGILVEPTDESALIAGFAAGMQRFVVDEALRNQLGHAGRMRAVREYDWERKVDQIISMYKRLLELEG